MGFVGVINYCLSLLIRSPTYRTLYEVCTRRGSYVSGRFRMRELCLWEETSTEDMSVSYTLCHGCGKGLANRIQTSTCRPKNPREPLI